MKMRLLPLVCSAVLVASFASAADFTVTSPVNEEGVPINDGIVNWSDAAAWSPNAPTISDQDIDIIWSTDPDGSSRGGGQRFVIDTDLSGLDIRSFTYDNTFGNASNPVLVIDNNLTLTGDFYRTQGNGGNKNFHIYGSANLDVGGNLTNAGGADRQLVLGGTGNNSLAGLHVGGDLATSNAVYFNVVSGATIDGLLSATGSETTTSGNQIRLNNSNQADGHRSVRVGAIATTVLNRRLVGGYNTTANNTYLTLTGHASNQTWAGSVENTSAAVSNGRLHIIMDAGNASFTQTFSGANSYTGDTILRQGNLKYNAAMTAIGDVYLGYGVTRDVATDVVTGIVAEENAETSIIFDGAGATVNNFNWSSGVVNMILSGAAETQAVVTLAGTFTFSNADAFTFNFENLTEGTTYKLFATTTDLSTHLSKFDSNHGNGFRYENNELIFNTDYVIPEPAEVALLLGAVAFGGALYARRRKKV